MAQVLRMLFEGVRELQMDDMDLQVQDAARLVRKRLEALKRAEQQGGGGPSLKLCGCQLGMCGVQTLTIALFCR